MTIPRFWAAACCVGTALLLGAGPATARDPFGGPTVVIAPGDVTPLRGPNIRNPLGPRSVYAPLPETRRTAPARSLGRDLDRELRRLPSRVTTRPAQSLPTLRLEQDRERAAAALESFKALRPNAPETSILERRLDRIQRPTDLGQ